MLLDTQKAHATIFLGVTAVKTRIVLALLCLALVQGAALARPAPKPKATPAPPHFFPYHVYQRMLPNGLAIIIIPTPEFKSMVTYATPVFAGSRNETRRGKTGLAHLFEHIMFRHEFGGKPAGYDRAIDSLGADNNAWTDYDLTFYHPFTFPENLVGPVQTPNGPVPGIIELESSRFMGLKLDRKTFQVEAGAVLGEYRRVFSNPVEKLIEVMSATAFPDRPYGHTVMGYREDVENMPNAWDAAWEFYDAYYRPNNVAVVVVGDVDAPSLFPVIEKAYATWKPRPTPAISQPRPAKHMRPVHENWDADVAPHLMVAWHTPAMNPASAEGAMALILPELLTSRSAALYQQLRYQKQTVSDFGADETPESTDPRWLLLDAELSLDRFKRDGEPYVNGVRDDIVAGVENLRTFSALPGAARTLELIKSKVRNDFLARLSTTEEIARTFSWYYRFDRDVTAVDRLMQSLMALRPEDVDAYASKYFNAEGRLVGTLWHGPAQEVH